tara:strand:+ start:3104 stop:4585 length:1482 start_codon:yes stop_codon:yes gene_type:complete
MAIKRYFLTKDTTITNAFKSDLLTRGTGSNMGASDILETFVIHGQTSASVNATNAEQSRVLVQFPIVQLLDDITTGIVPSSSVSYHLRMFNAPHGDTTPLSYSLDFSMVSGAAWAEGRGLDMEQYSDLGEANWVAAIEGTNWQATGGDYYRNGAYSASYFFSGGLEDVDLNVDFAINKWRSGANANYGLLLKHRDNVISGNEGTFYTKKFFSRTSDFFFKRPYLEARWDSSRKDNRGNCVLSSALAPASDNLNTIFLYNNIRGELKDIPRLAGPGQKLLVSFYSSSAGAPTGNVLRVIDSSGALVTNVTGGLLSENGVNITGTYSCSFAITSSFEYVQDVWHSGGVEYFTGSIVPIPMSASYLIYEDEYVTDVTNLRDSYIRGQKPRLRVFSRKKNWQPNIYSVATAEIEPEIIENSFYRLSRTIDNLEIIPFGTGSQNHTRLSYDVSGSYFELDTSTLESGYSYDLQFVYQLQGQYRQQTETFKFRIEEEAL